MTIMIKWRDFHPMVKSLYRALLLYCRARISFVVATAHKIDLANHVQTNHHMFLPFTNLYDLTLGDISRIPVNSYYFLQDFNIYIENVLWPPEGRWRLILKVGQVQIQRSQSNMSSCISNYSFVKDQDFNSYIKNIIWRLARHRYRGQTLTCLIVVL